MSNTQQRLFRFIVIVQCRPDSTNGRASGGISAADRLTQVGLAEQVRWDHLSSFGMAIINYQGNQALHSAELGRSQNLCFPDMADSVFT